MSQIQSIKLANEMKMHGIAAALERRLAAFANNSSDPAELIRLLLEDEKLSRVDKMTARLTTQAHFRRKCHLEDWDQTYERGINKTKLKELSALSFFHDRENLTLIGGTGSGKTHLAIALGHRLCAQGISVQFFSTNLLLQEIEAQRAAGKYLLLLKSLTRYGVIILDDFGLRNYDHDEATSIMDILEERYRKGAIIITSQVKPDGWLDLFEDRVSAEAIVDGLKNPSVTIQLIGGSYREKYQQKSDDRKVVSAKSKQ